LNHLAQGGFGGRSARCAIVRLSRARFLALCETFAIGFFFFPRSFATLDSADRDRRNRAGLALVR
jgi:hypothetical protein